MLFIRTVAQNNAVLAPRIFFEHSEFFPSSEDKISSIQIFVTCKYL